MTLNTAALLVRSCCEEATLLLQRRLACVLATSSKVLRRPGIPKPREPRRPDERTRIAFTKPITDFGQLRKMMVHAVKAASG